MPLGVLGWKVIGVVGAVAAAAALVLWTSGGGKMTAETPVPVIETPHAPAKLIVHQQTPPTVADVVRARAALDALPVDGLVVWSTASDSILRPEPVDRDALRLEFAPMKPGMFSHLTDNFTLVYATPAGRFNDFATTVAPNFATLATIARAAGFVGIFFDVEEYFGPTWAPSVACPGEDLATCRADARRAGEMVMRAILAVWPDVKFLVTTGASISEPLTAKALNPPTIAEVSAHNLAYGAFAVGLVQGVDGSQATFIDGAGAYTQNTKSDVARTVNWVTKGMAERSSFVPDDFRDRYARLVSSGLGVYDFPAAFLGKGPGDPAMWENDIAISLAGVRDYVWLYSERFNWGASIRDNTRHAPPDEWLQATIRGIARARS